MSKISAVIVAHNEEKKIEACLRSLYFVDEIVVVLDKCTDHTKEIVQKFTDKIIEGSWNLEGARRNVALSAADGEWILEIDADERVSSDLAKEILAVRNFSPCAFSAPIANHIGKRYVRFGWLRTLGVTSRQTMAYHGLKHYHEDKEVHPTCELNAEIKLFRNPIIHFVDEDISDLIARFNRYTTWRANDMIANKKIAGGKLSGSVSIISRFCKSFIFKKGYREGWLGFLIALLAGLYPIVSYLKAREKLSNK